MDVEGYRTSSEPRVASAVVPPTPSLRKARYALAFSVAGKIVGRRFTKALHEMQRAQWLPTEELRARTQARLAPLLQHAAENVPFYRANYRRLGLAANELRTVNDLQALPVVSKTTYREHRPEHFLAANVPAYRRIGRSTSGSTGQPFQFCIDRSALPLVFASHLFYDSWYGLRPFDRNVRIVSPPATVPPVMPGAPTAFRLQQAVTKRLQNLYETWTQRKILMWEVDNERAENAWRCIEAFRPDFVLGYTSTLALIADELLKRGLHLTRPLRGVITIAETLSPPRRRLINQYFNAPIINRYGLREFGSWSAQNCPESPDQFHMNTELVICEILREDGSPAATGEIGRVVLTDLLNYAMPFIRYDTGDLAAKRSDMCTCGRGFPLIGQIEGRSQECVRTPSGKVIAPVVLGHYLFVYLGYLDIVRHYQLVQESVDRVRLLVVPASDFDERERERLQNDLARLLGDDMTVVVEAVAEIPPEKSGKRPIIKSVCAALSD